MASTEQSGPALAESLPIEVIEIRGKSYVTGLLWEKLDRVRHYMAEAREKGKQYGLDIVAIRERDSGVQAGFSAKRKGVTKNMYSLAVVLGEVFGEDFVAALPVADGRFAVVAASRAVFLPGTDKILGAEEAEELAHEMTGRVRRQAEARPVTIVAPKSFQLPGSEEKDLETILDPGILQRSHQLRALTFGMTKKEIRLLVLSVATVAAAWYAWGAWREKHPPVHVLTAEEASKKSRDEAMAMAHASGSPAALPAAPVMQPHPWPSLPPVSVVVDACETSYSYLTASLGGWTLNNASCVPGSMTAVYARGPGATVEGFRAAVADRFHGAVDIEKVDSSVAEVAVTSMSITGHFQLPPNRTGDGPADPSGSEETLQRHFSRIGQPLDKWTRTPADLTPNPDQPAKRLTDWTTYEWDLTTTTPPFDFLDVPELTSYRITAYDFAVDAKTAEFQWTIHGVLYVQP